EGENFRRAARYPDGGVLVNRTFAETFFDGGPAAGRPFQRIGHGGRRTELRVLGTIGGQPMEPYVL
ncbi:MAG: hypothetical protein AAGM22_21305, partial [Acidobacteriota bacterium]